MFKNLKWLTGKNLIVPTFQALCGSREVEVELYEAGDVRHDRITSFQGIFIDEHIRTMLCNYPDVQTNYKYIQYAVVSSTASSQLESIDRGVMSELNKSVLNVIQAYSNIHGSGYCKYSCLSDLNLSIINIFFIAWRCFNAECLIRVQHDKRNYL